MMIRMVTHVTGFSFLALALSAISGALAARLLGPAGRGELAVVLLWPMLLTNVAQLGGDVVLGRLAARSPGALRALMGLALRLSVLTGGAAVLLGVVLAPWLLPPDLRHLAGPARLSFWYGPPSVLAVYTFAMALATGRLWASNVPRLCFSLFYLLGLVGLWAAGVRDLLAIVFVHVGSSCLVGIVAWVMGTVGAGTEPLPSGGQSTARGALWAAAPFGGVILFEVINQYLAVVLLSYLSTPAEIGLYTVAATVASLHNAFGNAVGKALFVRVAAQHGEQPGGWLAERVRCVVVLYIGIALAMMVALPPLIPLVYGRDFLGAQPLAVGQVVVTCALSVGRIFNEALQGAGQAAPGMAARIVGALVVTGLSFVLVPWLGVIGIVYAAGAGALVQLGVFTTAARRTFAVSFGDLWLIRGADLRLIAHVASAKLAGVNGRSAPP